MTTDLQTVQPRPMSLTPQNIDEALRWCECMSKSSILPREYQGSPGNILVAVTWGAELGLPPLQAMQSIAVINGRPSLWGDAVIALVRASGLAESIVEDVAADAATCTVKRRGEPATSRTFTMADAKRAGLAGKSGPWSQYPTRMLQMRARAWALRDVFPDVLRGVQVAEEVQDIPAERAMGAAHVVEPEPPSRPADSRTADLKERLLRQRAAAPAEGTPDPGPDLAEVLRAIAEAESPQALRAAADLAGTLTDQAEKSQARTAFAERRAALAEQSPTPADATPPTEQPPAWPQPDPETGELRDARGCPWIEGAHSVGRTCTDDGVWRRRRGADPEVIEHLERAALAPAAAAEASALEPDTGPEPDADAWSEGVI